MPGISRRKVSWSSIPVSRAGLGLSRIGSVGSPIGPRDAERLIQRAFDQGINLFDTADVYGQGDSERILGSALRSKRSEIVICTKAGLLVSAKARIASFAKPVLRPLSRALQGSRGAAPPLRAALSRPPAAQNLSPQHVATSIDGSLRRLGTDTIDLFLLHNPAPPVGPELDSVAELLLAAKQAGKVRAIGVSSRSPEEAAVWAQWPIVDVIQVRPVVGDRIQPVLSKGARSVGIIARQVLFVGANTEADRAAINGRVRAALQFADVVLFGTTSSAHLDANIAAFAEAER